MLGTPLNQPAIIQAATSYSASPPLFLNDLLTVVQQQQGAGFPVERELGLLHPESWMQLPCLANWRALNKVTNSRDAVEKMYGKNGWVAYSVTLCECGQPGACQQQTGQRLSQDHFYPVSFGGPFWKVNMKMLSGPCNRAKSNNIGLYVGDGDVVWRYRALIHLYAALCANGCS